MDMMASLARLGANWGWIVAYGAASVLLGIIAILWPNSTLVVIAIIFAVQLIFAAAYQFVFAFAIPHEAGWLRALTALLAVFSLIVGIYLLGHAVLTLLLLATLLGIYWIAQGGIEVFVAIGHSEIPSRTWIVLSGILSIAAGFVVVVFPVTSLVFLTIFLGAWLVLFGAMLVLRGWRLRSMTHRAGKMSTAAT